ncbi:MAG TPA: 30S ribosomal protein S16 [Candidatus Sulfotelmatobacter sp.]|nr:30S ribosomal protein S16 [Candidatus Sulfotelmatobacter sp.]
MSAKIKLKRIGTRNKPEYRVVVQDESRSPSSRVVAILGTYHTLKEPTTFEVDREKTLAWIKKGAKPTSRVRILLGKAGILPPVDLAALNKKKKKGEEPAVEAAAAPAAPAAAEAAAPATPKEG